MKNLLFVLLLGLICPTVFCQEKQEGKSIFEIGKKITSCEDNFDNLFHNWPKYVTNASDTELISYRMIETIEGADQINYYADWFTSMDDAWQVCHKSSYTSKNGIEKKEKYVYFLTAREICESQPDASIALKGMKKEMETLKEGYKSRISEGDKVYAIKMKYKGKEHEQYVICNSKTKRVAVDTCFPIQEMISCK